MRTVISTGEAGPVSPFVWRGVVEGFYGRPYSHAERLGLLRFMGQHGLNAYIYAPKNDPFHRARWNELYPAQEMARFKELIDSSTQSGVTFAFALSPGLAFRYSHAGDLELLLDKYRQFHHLGVTHFALFLDDIAPALQHDCDRRVYSSLAHAQANLAARLLERFPGGAGSGLWFCPTQYWGDPETPYIRELGERLPRETGVFWTGSVICSRVITTEYMERVAAALHRRPIIWDNYPVNDAGMVGEMHLGPYEGRDPDLYRAVDGVFLNPMNQAQASRVALLTAARYLSNPASYRPEKAWPRALTAVAHGAGAEAFVRFARANTTSPLAPAEPSDIEHELEEGRKCFAAMDFEGALEVFDGVFRGMEETARGLQKVSNSCLLAELGPWIRDYRFWTRLGQDATGVYRLMMQAGEAKGQIERARLLLRFETQLERLRVGLKQSTDLRTRVCGQSVANFVRDIYRQARGMLSSQVEPGLAGRAVLALYRKTGAAVRPHRSHTKPVRDQG